MLTILEELQRSYRHNPQKRRHSAAVKQSIAMLRNLLEHNPHELVLDPDDFVRRSIMLYLDETCWGLLLRSSQQQMPAAAWHAV